MNIKDLTGFLFSYKALFVLLTVFILLALYTATAVSEVFLMIAKFVKISVLEETLGTNLEFINIIISLTGISLSLYLLFILYSAISAVSTYKAYETAAQDYSFQKPDLTDAVFKAISWNFYRIVHILSPILTVFSITILLILLSIILFNTVLFLAGLSISIMTFLSSFIVISLAVGFVFALGLSIWNIFTTSFGIECAITEPQLENSTIKKRAKRLSLVKRSNIILCILYLIFILTVSVQLTGIILFPDMLKQENIAVLMVLIAIDIVFFIGLGYLKASFYIDSLLYQYDRITFRDKDYLNEIICELQS